MISIDRAKAIILCYGGYPLAWPAQERESMLQLLPDSKSLTDLQAEALALDGFMGFSDHSKEVMDSELDQQCAAKIMARLPEQTRKIKQVPTTFIENSLNRIQKTSKPTTLEKAVGSRFQAQAIIPRPTDLSRIMLIASVALVALGLSNSLQFNNLKDEAEQLSLPEYMTLYVDDAFFADEEAVTDDESLEILAFLEPQIMDDTL